MYSLTMTLPTHCPFHASSSRCFHKIFRGKQLASSRGSLPPFPSISPSLSLLSPPPPPPPVSPSLPPPLLISLSSSLSLCLSIPPHSPFLCVSPLYWPTHITLSSSTTNVLLSRCRCFVRLSFLLFFLLFFFLSFFPRLFLFLCLSVLLFVCLICLSVCMISFMCPGVCI